MSLDHCSTLTEHYRQMFRFGYHPTATRAVMLLCIRSHVSGHPRATTNNFQLSPFTIEDVLSFCVDAAQVLIVDITDEFSDLSSSSEATTALVVADDGETRQDEPIRWNHASPTHFIFTSMSYGGAVVWVQHWQINDEMKTKGISIDMHETYCNECDPFHSGLPSACLGTLVELSLPATISATSIAHRLLSNFPRLRSVDMSALTNITEIKNEFLNGCSALESLDLSPLANLTRIGSLSLSGCSAL
eukprot:PhM_4_TR10436/c5_g3_i2/m.77971